MRKTPDIAATLCLSALITCVYAAFTTTILMLANGASDLTQAAIITLSFGFCISLFVASSIGLPWHWLLGRLKLSSPIWYVAAGLIVGGIVSAFLIDAVSIAPGKRTFQTRLTAIFEHMFIPWMIGATSGGVFALSAWLIRRPDRDARPVRAPDTPPIAR